METFLLLSIRVHIVEVVPLVRGGRAETLSYFSAAPVALGAMVRVDVRRRKVWAIVVGVRPAEESRAEIRGARFSLKKIGKVSASSPFRPEFVAAAREAAAYFATSLGAVLASYLPAAVAAVAEKLPAAAAASGGSRGNKIVAKYAVMDRDEDRFAEYRSVVRSELARRRSILFLAPTAEDVRVAEARLSKGIGSSCFSLTGELSAKEFAKRWAEIVAAERPVVVVATPSSMAVPRGDWGAIVVERESSPSYRARRRPAIDARFLIERYAEQLGAPIFFGDLLLRADTVARWRSGDLMEHRALRLRAVSDAEISIVPLSKKATAAAAAGGAVAAAKERRAAAASPVAKRPFSAISDELAAAIVRCREENGRTFLFVARKGLAPILTCQDCGTAVSCETCERPLALFGGERIGGKGRELRCHTCGATKPAEDACKTCSGWRLIPLGIGTESAAAEIRAKFPGAQVAIVDAEHQKTPAAARKTVETWLASPGAILVGTEMAANLVREEYDCLGVVSCDALFAVPEYRMRERILAVLLHLRQHARRRVVIQTRLADLSLFRHAAQGNLADFYREELAERKESRFPPFGILVRISVAGRTKAEALKKANVAAAALAPHEANVYLGREALGKGLVPAHVMLTLPRENWPDPALVAKLRALSPEHLVEVDSDSIL